MVKRFLAAKQALLQNPRPETLTEYEAAIDAFPKSDARAFWYPDGVPILPDEAIPTTAKECREIMAARKAAGCFCADGESCCKECDELSDLAYDLEHP